MYWHKLSSRLTEKLSLTWASLNFASVKAIFISFQSGNVLLLPHKYTHIENLVE